MSLPISVGPKLSEKFPSNKQSPLEEESYGVFHFRLFLQVWVLSIFKSFSSWVRAAWPEEKIRTMNGSGERRGERGGKRRGGRRWSSSSEGMRLKGEEKSLKSKTKTFSQSLVLCLKSREVKDAGGREGRREGWSVPSVRNSFRVLLLLVILLLLPFSSLYLPTFLFFSLSSSGLSSLPHPRLSFGLFFVLIFFSFSSLPSLFSCLSLSIFQLKDSLFLSFLLSDCIWMRVRL